MILKRKKKKERDYSTPWYERYLNLKDYLKSEVAQVCLEEERTFLKDNLDIYVNHLPFAHTIMWMIKHPRSLVYHMDERFSKMDAMDLVPHIIFTDALLAKKGTVEFGWTRYYGLFAIFQYLLAAKIANETDSLDKDISDVRLFDFDAYDIVYARLEGKDIDTLNPYKIES